MTETTKTSQVVDTGIKVSSETTVVKTDVLHRKVSSKTIADDITSRVSGKLVGFDDLFDPKTKTFLTEKELVKKGAVFITISLNKVLGKNDCVVKSRWTADPTPHIRKTTKYQVIANINWASYVNKRGHGNFVSAEQRSNGIENYENCKVIGEKTNKDGKTYYYVNGVIFRSLESTKYFDKDGEEYRYIMSLKNEYFKKTWDAEQKAKQREADKHGIDIRFDPQYRTTRIDSCDYIRAFGFEYNPTENHSNIS